ncbi:YHS domain-containing protein [Halegenticoccus soli]|nr:YHS domain-containing protein [Halegenticoccus soli]
MAECPVCGAYVDEHNPPVQGNYRGETEYFCGVAHKEEFEEDYVQRT